MPQLPDIDGSKIPDMWGHCFVLDVGVSAEPTFTYVGEHHKTKLTANLIGRTVAAAGATSLVGQAASYHRQVLARGIPITLGGQFVDLSGRTVLYRSILLPLGESSGKITALLGGANCRELPEEAGSVASS